MTNERELENVKSFWERASCGEALYLAGREKRDYSAQAAERYRFEPYIGDLAEFEVWKDKDVLEIGVGLGADHQRFAECGARLTGIDLTERAVAHVKRRFDLFSLRSDLYVGNAESLPFPAATFDLVYSWGVVHHSPNTSKAIGEMLRVLKPGGEARIMIYHKYSIVGYMLWLRYAALRGRPLISLSRLYAEYLESPGTKAFTVREARNLFLAHSAEVLEVKTRLTHGDLLTSRAGQRHRGWMLSFARAVWPRSLIQKLLPGHGLFLTVKARKQGSPAGASGVTA